MASSNVLKNYEIPKDTNGTFRAKCMHCAAVISGSLKVTSNFITHMKRKHREIFISTKTADLTASPETLSSTQNLSHFFKGSKYSATDPRQLQITDALVHFIAGDLLPLSTVESPDFRKLMEKADPKYQVPSRRHLSTKLLHEKAAEVRNNLMEQLKLAENICLTIDLWSNRQMKGFLGITGHYILDWKLKSVMVCCKRVRGKHTSDNIRNEYEEALACFHVGSKIASIISDNAANMVKAFSLPGFESCKNTEENTDDEEEKDDDEDGYNEDNMLNVEDSDVLSECLPSHSTCFAHTLQLVVKDGLKQCSPHLKNVISKASNIVSFVRKSIHASEVLENDNRLQAANTTRWNSELHMIKSILNVPEEKLNTIECKYKLTSYERKLLSEVCSILDPFEEATLIVQKEISVSGSLTIPVTLGMKHKINSLSNDYSSKLVTALKTSIESRLSRYLSDDSYILATLLDPRFKTSWCEKECEANVQLLKDKVQSITSLTSVAENEMSPPPKNQNL